MLKPSEQARDRERPSQESPWLTYRQAEAYTGLSRRTLYQAIKDGELEASKPAGRILINRGEIDAWFRRHRVKHSPALA